MSEWIEWNGGEMPVCGYTRVTVRWRSGEVMTNRASKFEWTRNGFGDDVFAYRILEEKPKGHQNASILMDIAKEAAINPEYWKEFEIEYDRDEKCKLVTEKELLLCLQSNVGINIRRKPRTIRIGNYDVPEFYEAFSHVFNQNTVVIRFESEDSAGLMLKALKELAGNQ